MSKIFMLRRQTINKKKLVCWSLAQKRKALGDLESCHSITLFSYFYFGFNCPRCFVARSHVSDAGTFLLGNLNEGKILSMFVNHARRSLQTFPTMSAEE